MSEPFEPVDRLLQSMRAGGREMVSIQAIQRLIKAIDPGDLTDVQKLNHAAKMAHWQANVTSGLEKFRVDSAAGIELFKSVLDAGKAALNTCILINGGAVVALLAFVGNLMNKATPDKMPNTLLANLAWAMGLFAVGTLAGTVATGATYCAQLGYARDLTERKTINAYHRIAIGCVVVAYAAFLVGTFRSLFALLA